MCVCVLCPELFCLPCDIAGSGQIVVPLSLAVCFLSLADIGGSKVKVERSKLTKSQISMNAGNPCTHVASKTFDIT